MGRHRRERKSGRYMLKMCLEVSQNKLKLLQMNLNGQK